MNKNVRSSSVLEAIIASIAANAVVLGVLGFLFKSLISNLLDKDITQYRDKLEKENMRLQISYGGIFEKQATSIIELYKGLADLERATYKTIHYPEDPVIKWEWFRESWASVRNLYDSHRILLPEDIDQDFKIFLNKIFDGVLHYTNSDRRIMSPATADEFEKLMEKQDEALAVIEKEIPNLKESLIQKIRITLSTNTGRS
ncbi:MAG: hypothetical protein ACW7DY_22505 [Paraglaciecola chathamensis]